jgi:hypothetical protein
LLRLLAAGGARYCERAHHRTHAAFLTRRLGWVCVGCCMGGGRCLVGVCERYMHVGSLLNKMGRYAESLAVLQRCLHMVGTGTSHFSIAVVHSPFPAAAAAVHMSVGSVAHVLHTCPGALQV